MYLSLKKDNLGIKAYFKGDIMHRKTYLTIENHKETGNKQLKIKCEGVG